MILGSLQYSDQFPLFVKYILKNVVIGSIFIDLLYCRSQGLFAHKSGHDLRVVWT